MFTSRAEHRLLLRIDNADLRLTPKGREAGLVDDERWEAFQARRERFERNNRVLETAVVSIDGVRMPAARALKQPPIRLESLVASGQIALDTDGSALDLVSLETALKYEGYLRRQEQTVERLRRQEARRIPRDFSFERLPGLSREMVQRLSEARPETIAQALRIPGVTPAAVALVAAQMFHVEH